AISLTVSPFSCARGRGIARDQRDLRRHPRVEGTLRFFAHPASPQASGLTPHDASASGSGHRPEHSSATISAADCDCRGGREQAGQTGAFPSRRRTCSSGTARLGTSSRSLSRRMTSIWAPGSSRRSARRASAGMVMIPPRDCTATNPRLFSMGQGYLVAAIREYGKTVVLLYWRQWGGPGPSRCPCLCPFPLRASYCER